MSNRNCSLMLAVALWLQGIVVCLPRKSDRETKMDDSFTHTHTHWLLSLPERRHSTELTSPDQYTTYSWMDAATLQIHSTEGKGRHGGSTLHKICARGYRSRWAALLGFGAPWPEESKRKRDRERPRGPSHFRPATWHSRVPSRQIRVNRVAGPPVEESGSFAFLNDLSTSTTTIRLGHRTGLRSGPLLCWDILMFNGQ